MKQSASRLKNLQIVKLVKTVNIDNKTLTALLKAYATGEFELPERYKAELEKQGGHGQ
ncbi:MAG: DUF4315 family protein [Clostridiales bacterium]|nr:MAG: DUF4315 family protein [Clostridiales bacterium]